LTDEQAPFFSASRIASGDEQRKGQVMKSIPKNPKVVCVAIFIAITAKVATTASRRKKKKKHLPPPPPPRTPGGGKSSDPIRGHVG
jgi:hypothetical protein